MDFGETSIDKFGKSLLSQQRKQREKQQRKQQRNELLGLAGSVGIGLYKNKLQKDREEFFRNSEIVGNEKKYQQGLDELYENSGQIDEKSERVCSFVQVATACFSSFAHGSNDVANSIAPLATIYHIYQYNNLDKKSEVPIWILVLGGIGIVFGLSTWGYKIIGRMGNEITKISASRGFIIELSAALTIIIASRAEIPVSTTHCQVGGIVGCGLVGGIKNIKWTIIKKIVFSWLITLPVTGFLSAGLFSYGYYSPYENENYNFVNLTAV